MDYQNLIQQQKNLRIILRKTDYKAINLALNILSTMLADTGAKIESVKVNYQGDMGQIITPNLDPTKWEVNIDYINDYVGLNLSESEMVKCFRKVRMDAEKSKNAERAMLAEQRRMTAMERREEEKERKFQDAQDRASFSSSRRERVYTSRNDRLQYQQTLLNERYTNYYRW